MKTIKCAFLCSVLSLFFLASCLEGGGNSQSFPTDNAVVHYYSDFPGITFLDTPYGSVAAPNLNKESYKQGDCLFVSFTIDYDNQPAPQYYTATDITYEKIGKTDIIILDAASQNIDEIIEELSVDSIKSLGFALWSTVCCINNNLFMGFDQLDNKTQNYDYQLVYSDSFIEEIPVLYVCAKKSGLSSATPWGDYKYQAFDITPFLERYAEKGNTISFYLQYKKGVDAGNKNVYVSTYVDKLINLRFSDN